jgi:enoyl-CoA hydratase/carnithine racemase
LSKSPAVTISAIRGRARGAGSEFALATDIRFASRERAVFGQFEIGVAAAPGGGALNRLSGLVGRARAFEILVSGHDFDGELAEQYGYVNRAIPDEQFVDFVDAFAQRVSRFDLLALADIKRFVNAATLPADAPLGAEIDAFWKASERPAFRELHSQAFKAGYSQRGPVELNLGDFVGTILADPDSYPTR